jgi:predicted anti-sigma-YlaC factor YlaD
LLSLLALLCLLPACSVKRMAVNKIGNALASGGSTFESDDDLDLVGEALPFSLKLMESLLAESPRHAGLLTAAAAGFTQYGYAFVEQKADLAAGENLEASKALRARARRLYLRAYGYGVRGLELRVPGYKAAFEQDPKATLGRLTKKDVALLYWTAAAHGLAISASKDQPEMLAQLPLVEAAVGRVVELDPAFGLGAVQEFLVNLEAARTGVKPEARQQRMKELYQQALAASQGRRASTFVSYAENAVVPAQRRGEFEELLKRALAIDPDQHVEFRLANLVAQRRARWLLARVDELFLEPAEAGKD